MTDNEIIKALECCIVEGEMMCNKCPLESECAHYPLDDIKAMYALDLIKRQKTEIDKLKIEICALSQKRITFPERLKIVKHAREHAIKKFAERLKKLKQMPLITNNDIDNLVKEMTGDEK